MPTVLNPYLSFQDNARQAMEFYRDVFGGKLTITTYGEYAPPDTPNANNIMHAQLDTDNGMTLMGADAPPGEEAKPGSNFAVSLSGEDSEELHSYWDKLTVGGNVTVPLEKQMWGDEFGACIDRFGIPWYVNIGPPRT